MKLEIVLLDKEYEDLLKIKEDEGFDSVITLVTWLITSFIHDEKADNQNE